MMDADDFDDYNGDILETIENEEAANDEEEAGDNEEGAGDDPAEQDAQEGGDENETSSARLVKPKKVVRKPRLKLDDERLCAQRGLPALTKMFDGVKFNGRGHERQDLDKLMSVLEHWSHRLYPKQTFDENLDKIEKLGSKRSVQTCVKKLRLDLFAEDAAGDDRIDDEVDGGRETEEVVHRDAFDDLCAQYEQPNREAQATLLRSQANTSKDTNTLLQPEVNTSKDTSTTETPNILTEEQLMRIERNRKLALERRNARKLAEERTGQTVEENNASEDINTIPQNEPIEKEFISDNDASHPTLVD